jgi:UDP-N-acetylglucosamine--N-acetylmuramyl-(pentapeptide) pyrophosphoryl-undecaprenol N-acetylglucosamine transferase
MKNILITAGGTGGHLFPAKAIAEELSKKGNVPIMATDKRCISYLEGFLPNIYIVRSLRFSSNPLKLAIGCFSLMVGLLQAIKIIHKHKINVIVGFGGYPTIPILLAGVLLRRDIIIHEQNIIAGRVNRFFAKFAKKILVTFPETQGLHLQNPNIEFVGLPVRQAIIDATKTTTIKTKDFNILVFGGSQGSAIFDETVPQMLELLDEKLRNKIYIRQQSRDPEAIIGLYKKLNIKADVRKFFTDIELAYREADLIVARAGAASLAEIAIMGKAAIIVPYPYAKDNHQLYNAKYFLKNDACIMVEQKDFSAQKLADLVNELILDSKRLVEIGKAARQLAVTNSLSKILELI